MGVDRDAVSGGPIHATLVYHRTEPRGNQSTQANSQVGGRRHRDSEPATVTVRDGWDRVYKTVITQSRGNRMMTMTLWRFAQEWLYAASAFTV